MAIGNALYTQEYAIIGGAALVALGSTQRTTEDVNILVNPETTTSIKNLLSQTPNFSIDKRTRLLQYSPNIRIDVLTPSLAKIPETEISQAITTKDGVKVVNPTTLLNYKISSAYTRSSEGKKMTDWMDVSYLVNYHVQMGMQLTPGMVSNATYEAFNDLSMWTGNVTEEEWKYIGGSVADDSLR